MNKAKYVALALRLVGGFVAVIHNKTCFYKSGHLLKL